jgi:homoserine kinase
VGFVIASKMATGEKSDSGYGWRAVVPATSANLGCAFDCGGLALQLYLSAFFTAEDGQGLTLEYHGETPERFPLDESNLVVHALRFAADELHAAAPKGRVVVQSAIPIGVGLGSSAAAVIAGLLLGTRYAGAEVVPEELLRWAGRIEGHLDNAAAAYHGGLVFALSSGVEQVRTFKSRFPEAIRLVIVTPETTVSTHESRKALPESYSREDVLHVTQRLAALAATCFSGEFALVPELFADRLHQPYRQKLVPGMEQCLRFRHPGLLGVAISGSGSSVIAFVQAHEMEIAKKLKEIFAGEGQNTTERITSADNNGAWVSREPVQIDHITKELESRK